jgi:hypothetical protein
MLPPCGLRGPGTWPASSSPMRSPRTSAPTATCQGLWRPVLHRLDRADPTRPRWRAPLAAQPGALGLLHAGLPGRFTRGPPFRKGAVTGAVARCGPEKGCSAVADTLEDDRPPLAAMLADRRRSGRKDYENAHLIALLRDQPAITNPATEVYTVPKMLSVDDLSSARILIGLPIAAAMCGRWRFLPFGHLCDVSGDLPDDRSPAAMECAPESVTWKLALQPTQRRHGCRPWGLGAGTNAN